MMRALLLLALVGIAAASCPNDCSGNGYCNQYSACNCYRNWMGADCSQRSCAWAHSFVDVPQGDLNGDGRLDKPNIYKVTLCSTASFFAQGATTTMTSYNGDQHTTLGTGTYTKLAIEDADGSTWNTGIQILENVHPEDEFSSTTGNDPYGVVARCNERDENLDYAIVVHVTAAADPGLICDPNDWQRDDAGMTSYAAGVNRFARCDDVTGAAALNVDDLKRGFTLTPSPSSTFSSAITGFVGDWSDMTYPTQMTNDPLWERYPDDHYHAGKAFGVDYGTLDEPKTDDSADGAADFSKDDWDEAHFYAECSAKGLCDRSTGLCQCFPGFTGDGCMRSACPNDCSGHGVCERLVDQNDMYLSWDSYKTQVCKCDAGYSGPHCGLRECPKGDDPVTRLHTGSSLQAYTVDGREHTGHRTQTAEIQVIGVTNYELLLTGRGSSSSKSTQTAPFALEFTDEMGDKWTTRTIDFRGGAYVDCTSSYLGEACTLCASTTNDCQTEDGFGRCDGSGVCEAGARTGAFVGWAGDFEAGTANSRPSGKRNQEDVADDIESALEALPNQVIPNVEVNPQKIKAPAGCTCAASPPTLTCTGGYGAAIPNALWVANTGIMGADSAVVPTVTNGRITSIGACPSPGAVVFADTRTLAASSESLFAITFVENAGDIDMLGARYQWEFELTTPATESACLYNIDISAGGDGYDTIGTAAETACTYSMNKADGSFDDVLIGGAFYADELFKGDKEEATCSNRGICDYSTGLCKCFSGFTSHDCSVQNALSSA